MKTSLRIVGTRFGTVVDLRLRERSEREETLCVELR